LPIVANGVSADTSLRLKQACERLPDCTVLFLTEEVHDDIARLLGIDHAISDYILFATPLQAQIDALPEMIELLRKGNDVVIGEGDSGVVMSRGWFFTAMFNLFRHFHKLATGRSYEALSPAFRAYSRAAALYIATRRDGEVLIRARALGQGFPSATVAARSSIRFPIRSMSFRMAVSKAVRLLLTGSSAPLRLLRRLASDIERIRAWDIDLINLFPEPMETTEILDAFFPGAKVGPKTTPAPAYGLRTRYSQVFGGPPATCSTERPSLVNWPRSSRRKGKGLPRTFELSVSNIAFPVGELEDALALLAELNIDRLEVAPHNVFGRWDVSGAQIDGFRQRLADAGMRCIALQGITLQRRRGASFCLRRQARGPVSAFGSGCQNGRSPWRRSQRLRRAAASGSWRP
jgi:hypothetical protein